MARGMKRTLHVSPGMRTILSAASYGRSAVSRVVYFETEMPSRLPETNVEIDDGAGATRDGPWHRLPSDSICGEPRCLGFKGERMSRQGRQRPKIHRSCRAKLHRCKGIRGKENEREDRACLPAKSRGQRKFLPWRGSS